MASLRSLPAANKDVEDSSAGRIASERTAPGALPTYVATPPASAPAPP